MLKNRLSLPSADQSHRSDPDARRQLASEDGPRGGVEDGIGRPDLRCADAHAARLGDRAEARRTKMI